MIDDISQLPYDSFNSISDDGVDDGGGGVLERFLLGDFAMDVDLILNSYSFRVAEDRFHPIFYILLKGEGGLLVDPFVLEGVDEELMEIIMTVGVVILVDCLRHRCSD